MTTVLAALTRAAQDDDAGTRQRVIDAFFSAGTQSTAVGPLTVEPDGVLAAPRFSTYRLKGGQPGIRAGLMSTATAAPKLQPTITGRMLTVFVIGDVLGAGIYALVGEVGGEVGGAIWTAFLLAGVLALFTAASYAELVTKYPRAAGAALYVNRAWGSEFFTFVVAFAVMASGVTSAATLATAFGGDYLSEFVDLPTILVGLAFVAVISLVNFRGIKESVGLNFGLTMIELGGLLLVVVIGLAFLLDGGGDTGPRARVQGGRGGPARDPRRRVARVLRADRVRGLRQRRRGDPRPVARVPARAVPRPRDRRRRLHARDRDRLDGGPDRQARRLRRAAARGRRPGPARHVDEGVRRRSRCSRSPTAR